MLWFISRCTRAAAAPHVSGSARKPRICWYDCVSGSEKPPVCCTPLPKPRASCAAARPTPMFALFNCRHTSAGDVGRPISSDARRSVCASSSANRARPTWPVIALFAPARRVMPSSRAAIASIASCERCCQPSGGARPAWPLRCAGSSTAGSPQHRPRCRCTRVPSRIAHASPGCSGLPPHRHERNRARAGRASLPHEGRVPALASSALAASGALPPRP